MNPLLALGVVLATGIAFGAAARRVNLPAVTGQIVGGVAIGQSGLALFGAEAISALQPVTEFALGLIAVSIGGHLNLSRLRNAGKRLTLLLLAESTITPLITIGVLRACGYGWPVSLLFAAMAVSTAPDTTLAMIKETRARGTFVKTLVGGVALNNVACIFLFEIGFVAAKALVAPTAEGSLLDLARAPLRALGASLCLGAACGGVLVVATRQMIRPERLAAAAVMAILLTVGLAIQAGVSVLLTSMFLGVAVANFAPERQELAVLPFANFEAAILAVFFTLAGMQLHLDHLVGAGGIVAAVFLARFAGKVISASVAMTLADATRRIRRYLGLALLPQAGVGVGLILLVQQEAELGAVRDLFLTAGLALVALNEMVGPLLTRYALMRSGDAGHDRPRLIDFIREEHILTDFEAESKEDAIEQLVTWMLHTQNLGVSRKALLTSVLRREEGLSTCVGRGLAIPHGDLGDRGEIAGVMGISRKGLALETPDGEPVHCMVLLATPSKDRDRHLEVLAALMRAIGADDNVRRRLFNARSPAHAYEILHAEEAADFNYFLD